MSSMETVFGIISGSLKIRVKLEDPNADSGRRYGYVIDESGNVIGDASDRIYGGRGFAVHTAPFGGYVPADQIVFV